MTDITVTCHLPSGSNVTWSNVTWWNNGTSIEESTFDESAFLQFSQGFLDDTLGFFFIKSQFCIALAVLLIIQYHIRHYLAGVKCVNWINEVMGAPSISVKRIGMNLLILQFYLGPLRRVQHEIVVVGTDPLTEKCMLTNLWAFNSTVILIFVDSILLNGMFYGIGQCLAPGYIQALDKVKTPMEVAREDGRDSPASNVYMDMTCPFSQSFMIMIVQVGLFYLYILHFQSDYKTHNSDPNTKMPTTFRYLYWILGVLIQLFAGEKALGNSVNLSWWKHLLGLAEWPWIGRLFKRKHDDVASISTAASTRQNFLKQISEKPLVKNIHMQHRYVWLVRFVMDWGVNGLGRTLILFTFPIMLSVEEALDFVKDCMAVFFITQLDDVREKDWTELMVRIKFNVSFETGEPVPLHPHEAQSVIDEEENKYGDKYYRQRQYHPDDGEHNLLKLMVGEHTKKTA